MAEDSAAAAEVLAAVALQEVGNIMGRFNFSEKDKEKVKAAVEELEKVSSGEIVTYFAKKSSNYDSAKWSNALLFMASATFMLTIMSYMWWLPGTIGTFETSGFILLCGIFGYVLAGALPSYRLFIVGRENAYHKVRLRAIEAFINEEVFNTRDRTGILFYVSALEHQVIVMGDSGINQKVNQEDWDSVVKQILEGIKTDEVSDGLVKAIHSCKELLIKNGFHVRSDDTNELSDDIRIEDHE
ncbi:MAG: hypothetical protein RJQ05_12055 [Cytophagales bacterium]